MGRKSKDNKIQLLISISAEPLQRRVKSKDGQRKSTRANRRSTKVTTTSYGESMQVRVTNQRCSQGPRNHSKEVNESLKVSKSLVYHERYCIDRY